MLGAVKVVRNGSVINIVSHLNGVPRSTLKDRLSSRIKHGTKPGPQCYLDSDEEKALAHHLVEAAALDMEKHENK